MTSTSIANRKHVINERYWDFSIMEPEDEALSFRRVNFRESIRELAENLGIRVEILKQHVQPRTITLTVRCDECKRVHEVTETFHTRHDISGLYTCYYACKECQAMQAKREAQQLAASNDALRQKYGSMAVRDCPNCGSLTHLAFDPLTLEFYETCSKSVTGLYDEVAPCFVGSLTADQRKFFLPKLIALFQAKVALS